MLHQRNVNPKNFIKLQWIVYKLNLNSLLFKILENLAVQIPAIWKKM